MSSCNTLKTMNPNSNSNSNKDIPNKIDTASNIKIKIKSTKRSLDSKLVFPSPNSKSNFNSAPFIVDKTVKKQESANQPQESIPQSISKLNSKIGLESNRNSSLQKHSNADGYLRSTNGTNQQESSASIKKHSVQNTQSILLDNVAKVDSRLGPKLVNNKESKEMNNLKFTKSFKTPTESKLQINNNNNVSKEKSTKESKIDNNNVTSSKEFKLQNAQSTSSNSDTNKLTFKQKKQDNNKKMTEHVTKSNTKTVEKKQTSTKQLVPTKTEKTMNLLSNIMMVKI
mmetsp:Transcript_10165/g.22331  ORF Transcript_10165/g.22331 Transcript_10165/m.22331 type:complete len:284 (-) Transcript_10165:24-875(-)